jgi:hypothetical protein
MLIPTAKLYNIIAQRESKLNFQMAGEQRKLAHASKRDSGAQKTIALLGALFLPGAYLAVRVPMFPPPFKSNRHAHPLYYLVRLQHDILQFSKQPRRRRRRRLLGQFHRELLLELQPPSRLQPILDLLRHHHPANDRHRSQLVDLGAAARETLCRGRLGSRKGRGEYGDPDPERDAHADDEQGCYLGYENYR